MAERRELSQKAPSIKSKVCVKETLPAQDVLTSVQRLSGAGIYDSQAYTSSAKDSRTLWLSSLYDFNIPGLQVLKRLFGHVKQQSIFCNLLHYLGTKIACFILFLRVLSGALLMITNDGEAAECNAFCPFSCMCTIRTMSYLLSVLCNSIGHENIVKVCASDPEIKINSGKMEKQTIILKPFHACMLLFCISAY